MFRLHVPFYPDLVFGHPDALPHVSLHLTEQDEGHNADDADYWIGCASWSLISGHRESQLSSHPSLCECNIDGC